MSETKSVFDTDEDRVAIYRRAAEMSYVNAVKSLRADLRTGLKEAVDLARAIAEELPSSPLAKAIDAQNARAPTPSEKGPLLSEVEKLIAGTCFPSNPDMSGDPRRRLGGHAMHRVETCASAIMDAFVAAGFQPTATD